MSSQADILRKKMRPSSPAVGPRLTWWRAELDRALRRICKKDFKLDVKVTGQKGRQLRATEALDQMDEIVLPMLLTGADQQKALFILDGALVDGMIEQQLLGEVLPTARLNRPVTAVDAGLNEPFVKAVLATICAAAPDQFASLTLNGMEQDRATLGLELGDGQFDILEAQLDLGPGIKTGRFELWLPSLAGAAVHGVPKRENPEFLDLLQSTPVALDAWLSNCETTAHQLLNLEVGSVLLVPRSALQQVEVKDRNGGKFAEARLGQLHGVRAVRFTQVRGKDSAPKPQIKPAEVAMPVAAIEPLEPAATGADLTAFSEDLEPEGIQTPQINPSVLAG